MVNLRSELFYILNEIDESSREIFNENQREKGFYRLGQLQQYVKFIIYERDMKGFSEKKEGSWSYTYDPQIFENEEKNQCY